MRVEGELAFLSAGIAAKIGPVPQLTRVPGAPAALLGVALYDDEIIPVLAIGSARDAMVLCDHLGERLGIVGGEIVGTGVFEVDGPDVVVFQGERVKPLDVATLYARVRASGWGGRWEG